MVVQKIFSSCFIKLFRSLFFLEEEIACAIQAIRNMHPRLSWTLHGDEAYNPHFLPSLRSAVTSRQGRRKSSLLFLCLAAP